MTITFLNAENFAKVNGNKEKYLHAGFGTGRNVMYWKQDEFGNIFGRLSPISDKNYDGFQQKVGDRFAMTLQRMFG